MREFNVKVNGQSYHVEVEEIINKTTKNSETRSEKKSAPTKSATAAPVSAPAAGGVGNVISPLPGTVLELSVAVGDKVKRGDIVLLLEAMKMQNEIVCPVDGEVEAILVASGQHVDKDAVLMVVV